MTHQDSTRKTCQTLSWTMVAFLMAQAALGHFNRVSMSVAGSERLMADHALSETHMGMVYSSFLLAYTLFMLPGGWIIDRFGGALALTLMGLGLGAFVVATGVLGFVAGAFSLITLMIIRFGAGVASAPLHPAAAQIVSQSVPVSQRTFVNGLITGAAILGVAATFSVFGTMIDVWGWPTAFLVSGIATAGLAIAWQFVSHRPESQLSTRNAKSSKPNWSDFLLLARNRSLLLLTASYAAIGYFEFLFFYWLQHYLFKVHDLSVVEARWYSTIPTLAMAAGMPIGGWISDRLTMRGYRQAWVPACGMIVSAGMVGIGVSCTQPVLAVACFAIAMAAAGACEGPFWTAATQLGGSRGGLSAAIVNTGGNAGGMLAPVITPILSFSLGWSGAIGVAGLLCLLGAFLWKWIEFNESPKSISEDSSVPPVVIVNC